MLLMIEGGVEVDQVNPLGSQTSPPVSHLQGITERAFGTGHPLLQLDGASTLDVNGWK